MITHSRLSAKIETRSQRALAHILLCCACALFVLGFASSYTRDIAFNQSSISLAARSEPWQHIGGFTLLLASALLYYKSWHK